MPRIARISCVGAVHHVISRFVDRSWQLAGERERAEYLGRLAIGLQRARWRLLGYALMSSHIHLLAEASDQPLAIWAKPVHVGMAQWLNRRHGRLGPVFAGRPYCEVVAPAAVPIVLAYLHNNPVRAGVVACALECTWTSHRAYLGLDDAPAGLDVPRGLALTGFANDAAGRAELASWVQACALADAEGVTSSAEISTVHRKVREELGSAIHLGTATRDVQGPTFALLSPRNAIIRRGLELEPDEVIGAVYVASGINLALRSAHGPRALSRARRAALALWGRTIRPRSIMARAMGVSANAASKLSQSCHADDLALADMIAKASEILGAPVRKGEV